jgi:ABC-2 type transport system ATP-binding protein
MSETETNEPTSAKAPPPPAVDAAPAAPASSEPPAKDAVPAAQAPAASEPPKALVASADADAGASKKKKKKEVEYAVRLNKITKRFGNKTAVDGLSLKIKQGSVYGLIGPNGAGKTTTFSMMAGFLRPTEGTIEMLGYAPTQVDELRARVGVLPQDAVLPPTEKVGEFLVHMARLQNIPVDKAESAAREVLAEVDGRDWWNVRCSSLSHGMAKRVQLAQAIMGEPEIVLLDEPTAGLDPRVAYEVRQLVRARKGRCTLIVSSHNLQELEEICDAAAILDRGRVIESGSMGQLTAANQEIHIKISPPAAAPNSGPHRSAMASVPMDAVRAIPAVTQASFDTDADELVVNFDRRQTDAETVIGQVLWCLLNNQVRISSVTKGKGLEQRVMELTE